jgi:rubrerythrin
MSGEPSQAIFSALAAVAERVRWRLNDVPWGRFEPAAVTPGLRGLVKEMAFSESATFSATQRFMQAFSDDVDFTQWLSVWFYEETRHPHLLSRWLQLAGDSFDDDLAIRGRVSAPFMKSRMGTLVTNVISEINAADAYLSLSEASGEPLLAELARRIASDEARHAASFFVYAGRQLERAADPDRERLDALKILHLWLSESQNVSHPVNQMMQRARALEASVPGIRTDSDELRSRICTVVGTLTRIPLEAPEQVHGALSELTARVHAGG